MKTVDKAMTVLDQFSVDRTDMGLSELSRLSQLDKAATRRLLVALSQHGFIEQSADTKKYRLGIGFLRLARLREATVPLTQAAQEVADWLMKFTDETVHVSVPLTTSMATIAHQLPLRGNIINIIPAQALPFHATAAGIAYLSAATPDTLKRAMSVKRNKTTPNTTTSKTGLLTKIKETQEAGHAYCYNTFELGVASIAMPFFLDQSDPAGTISIALADSNMSDARRAELLPLLRQAIGKIEQSMTGY